MDREQIVQAMIDHSRSLFQRNYTYSTGGNLSHRFGDGMLISATNTSFGRLLPGDFVACDLSGRPLPGEALQPSKEAIFHAAIYRARPEVGAVLHLHSQAAIALSCLAVPTDTGNVLPAVTSGSVTRVGRVPLIEYIPPGAQRLAERIEAVCRSVNAILLQNHGVVTYAPALDQAVDIAEELEQNIKVWLMTGGQARILTDDELAGAKPLFGAAVAPGTQRPVLREGVNLGGGLRL
ncbi:ribulose-5-phosphate 4-epimerase/fuculose-1-phosphate aldolase [Symbiobacterium terraclitae]|uniref:Ribulose-5-phosphate 4-epimerase/fuculose-1-phosphate aldolase n=1 Tax=Symbiobacterium terraclitae TaxID=557451 RepID=A0ABS4JWT7_9FIRM|nr:class II aldolase/adducin family protein [Symbiobacterium terraclitae]MBP2019983.1 ribulose-5-phosphate 4-epimerase/fuculose-1-phosphate aldolase [Symbiobacterium terraclitae]